MTGESVTRVQAIFRVVPLWLVVAVVVAGMCAACFAQVADKAPSGKSAPSPFDRIPTLTLFQLLVRGGWLMVPIGLCSLIGLAIIIERSIVLRRRKIIPPNFLGGLKSTFRHAQVDRAAGLEYCRTHDCPVARVISAGINKSHRGEETVERVIEDAGAAEVTKLTSHLRMLYAVAAVAPMLGLLGTVWGMISAFQVAAAKGLGRPELMAKGIYEALVTTLGGLSVAIPIVLCYHYFLGKIEKYVGEMNEISIEFLEHYMSEETPRRAAAHAEPVAAD